MRDFISARVRPLRVIVAFIAIVLLAGAHSLAVFAFSGTGSGSIANPYKVATCDDLQDINNDLDAYYVQTGNIDCSESESWNSGAGFAPIGTNSSTPFTGSFDGQNFVISDIYQYTASTTFKALFGATSGATIKNIRLSGGSVSSQSPGYSASLVGTADDGTVIQDCSSNVAVHSLRGAGLVGLLVGASTIDRCSYSGDMVTNYGVSNTYGYGASLVGDVEEDSAVTDVFATGTLHVKGPYNGSLVGYIGDGGTITNGYSAVDVVSDDGWAYNGGLIGSGSVFGSVPSVSNIFFAGTLDTEDSTHSGIVVGSASDIDLVNIYYNSSGCASCGSATIGSDGGTGTRNFNSTSNLNNFKVTGGQPMASWDYDTIWQANDSAYATLQVASTPTDSDGDGVLNATEDYGPNGGDANNDGIKDSAQANVSSIVNDANLSSVVLEVSDNCEIAGVDSQTESEQEVADSSYKYALGLLNFTLNCDEEGATATIKQYYVDYDHDSSYYTARKLIGGEYATIAGATLEDTVIDNNPVIIMTYQVTDGGEFDADGSVNTEIVDPAGLGRAQTSDWDVNPSESLANTGATSTAPMIFGFVLVASSLGFFYTSAARYSKLNQ